MRSRRLHDLAGFAEAVRNIAVFYDGIVVPGALVLLASGAWMIDEFFGGWVSSLSPGMRGWCS